MLLLLLPSEYVYPVSHRLSGALFFKEREKGKEKRVPRVGVRIYTVSYKMNITGSETYAGKELRSTAGNVKAYGKKKAVWTRMPWQQAGIRGNLRCVAAAEECTGGRKSMQGDN